MAVPTTLAEALALLTFSTGNQISGQDVRDVVTWLGSLQAETFTPVLTLDRSSKQTATAYLGKVFIALAASGHVPGSTKIIVIPAGTVASASDLVAASDLNTDGWEPLVPASDYVVIVTAISATQFVSSGKNMGTRDAALPTIVSATVNVGTNADGLVVVFNEATYLPGLTGVSAQFTNGTPRSITAIEAVSADSKTWTLTLSGNVSPSDVLSLVLDTSRTWQDLNGNLIAAGSTPVTVVAGWDTGDLTNLRLWIDPGTGHATSEGAGVASVTNQGSLGGTFTQGTAGSRPIYNANGFGAGLPWFSYDGTDDSLVSTITFDQLTTDAGEWYFGAVVAIDAINTDAANDANEAIMSESAGYWSAMFRSSNGFNGYVWDGAARLSAAAVGAPPVAKALVEFRSTGGNIFVRVNKGTETQVAAGDVQIVNGTLRIGADRTPVNFLDFKHGELWFTDGDPGTTQRNAQADAMIAKYAIP